ncbi:MAG: hypothetical protein JSU77_00775 [Fidelibacterota bacterium]|nr:MAG: hypothetical protein JSU77_00775 [Candidatus Neomarinimicrobiota bacterium]
MASIFDSPLFWIIAVWWLLTTLLGSKARRRRAMQARSAQPPDQPATPFEKVQQKVDSEFSPEQEQPAEVEIEGEVLEAKPMTSAPGLQEYPDGTRAAPPTRPTSPLEDLFRKLGISEELVPGVLRPEEEEAPLVEELEITTTPEYAEESPTLQPVEPPPTGAREYIPAPTRYHYPLLAETTRARLTPLQQVVVFKEILDRPWALRRLVR